VLKCSVEFHSNHYLLYYPNKLADKHNVAEREMDYETAYYSLQDHKDDAGKNRKGRMLKEKMYAYCFLVIGASSLIGTGNLQWH